MKFSEFIGSDLLVEKNEEKVLSILKKNMQSVLDKVEKDFKGSFGKWLTPEEVASIAVYSQEEKDGDEYLVDYYLRGPKKISVESARDFETDLDKALKNIEKGIDKTFRLPFFRDRWIATFGSLSVSGRGPWRVAEIKIRPVDQRGEMSPDEKQLWKDENAFQALRSVIDEIRIFKNGEDLLRYAKRAGRVSPEIVKEAKKLAKTIIDFKTRAEAEIKKLASQHPDDYIKRHYS